MKNCVAVILFLAMLFVPASGARADTAANPAVEREAQTIFGEVMSPFCPGRLLSDCPSSQAAELRNDIRGKLASGVKEEQILDELYSVYHDEIRAAPPRYGFGMVAWLAPFGFLLIGIALWAVYMRRQREEPEQRGGDIDPKILAEIEREVGQG